MSRGVLRRAGAAAILAIAAAGAGTPGAVPAARADAAVETAFTRVRYLSGGSVYLEVGRLDGLAEGDTLQVIRGGQVIARLRAVFLASHRAACDTLAVVVAPRIGDPVRYAARPIAAAPDPAEPADSAVAAAVPPRARRSVPPIRGRIGARWLTLRGGPANLSQPSLDLRLDGTGLGAAHLDVGADVRARRSTRGDETEDLTRVYRLSASLHDRNGRVRLTAGRQLSAQLASVSLFDGAMVEVGGARWSLGAFSGTQPEPVRMGFSGDILEHGGFLLLRTGPGAARSASVVLGGVHSTAAGGVNRSFGFAQAWYRDPRLSAWLTQEVDVNPAWKRALGDAAIQPTNTYSTARWEVVRGVILQGGWDGRRNVRLWRDRETPETQFDDRTRQGTWGGVVLEPARLVRLSADARGSRVLGGTNAASWSTGIESMRRLPAGGRARLRVSRYDDDLTRTELVAGSLGLDPVGAVHLEVGSGVRRTRAPAGGAEDRTSWTSADLDVVAGRRLLVNVSVEREEGIDRVFQTWAGLSVRF